MDEKGWLRNIFILLCYIPTVVLNGFIFVQLAGTCNNQGEGAAFSGGSTPTEVHDTTEFFIL